MLANQNKFSGTELSRSAAGLAHDSVSRWLSRSDFKPSELWSDVKKMINVKAGYLVGDDSVLDKQYSCHNELAKKQYSGNV